MTNTCFIDNLFVRDGAVIRIGTDGLDVSNNYISPADDQLACSLVATYPDEASWLSGTDVVCTNAVSESCQSDLPPVSPPSLSPDEQPTRVPVPRVTLAPVAPPPESSPTTPSGSVSKSFCLHAIYASALLAYGLVLLA